MPKPKPRKTVHIQNALVVTPHEAFAYDKKGQGGPTESAQKLKGATRIVDLTDTVDTTFGNFAEFTQEEVAQAILTDPRDYLPKEAPAPEELFLDVLPTQNEQGRTAALIAYVRKSDMGSILRNLSPSQVITVEPAVVIVANDYIQRGEEAAVLQVSDHYLTGLLVSEGQIRSRLREIISPSRTSEQGINMLSTLASLGNMVTHIGLTGRPDTVEEIASSLSEEGLEVRSYGPEQLAECAIKQPLLFNLRPQAVRKANPLLPLGVGLAAGLLPGLVIGAGNQTLQSKISTANQATAALRPQVDEANRLSAEIKNVRDTQQKAEEITKSRVNWDKSLTTLTAYLPQESDKYNVMLSRLKASIANPPAAAAATPTNGVTPDNNQGTPPGNQAANPVLSTPLVKYDLEMVAVSRFAATTAISNFEKNYNFNLTSISRNESGGWSLRGTATEKNP